MSLLGKSLVVMLSLIILASLTLIIHGTSGWLVSMDGLGCGVALAG